MEDEKVRRPFWKLGVVEQIILGRDGQIRGAIVRVWAKDKGCKLLRRPIQHLYPLEVDETKSGNVGGDPSEPDRDHHETQARNRDATNPLLIRRCIES